MFRILSLMYFIYYILIPIGIITILAFIYKAKDFSSGGSKFFYSHKKGEMDYLEEGLISFKKFQALLVLFLLLSLPFLTFSSIFITDQSLHRERFQSPEAKSKDYVIRDPVDKALVSTFDTRSVIEKMKKNPDYWHTDQILEQVDLNKISQIPGRLAVYRIDHEEMNQVIITHTYFSPIPITKSFGFVITSEGKADLVEEKTLVYPINPGAAEAIDEAYE